MWSAVYYGACEVSAAVCEDMFGDACSAVHSTVELNVVVNVELSVVEPCDYPSCLPVEHTALSVPASSDYPLSIINGKSDCKVPLVLDVEVAVCCDH